MDFLFLYIEIIDICICGVGFFIGAEYGDGGVGFGGENIDEGVWVVVEGDGWGGFKFFVVEGGEDVDDIVWVGVRLDDVSVVDC